MNAYKLIPFFYWIHFSDSLVTCLIHLISFLSISDMEQIAPPPLFFVMHLRVIQYMYYYFTAYTD